MKKEKIFNLINGTTGEVITSIDMSKFNNDYRCYDAIVSCFTKLVCFDNDEDLIIKVGFKP